MPDDVLARLIDGQHDIVHAGPGGTAGRNPLLDGGAHGPEALGHGGKAKLE